MYDLNICERTSIIREGSGGGQRDLPVASVSDRSMQRGGFCDLVGCQEWWGCRSFCRSGDNVAALTRASCTSLER